MKDYLSWGRYPKASHKIINHQWSTDNLDIQSLDTLLLPFGLGRSYGDSCLNNGHTLIDTSKLNHFLLFDHDKGIMRCESGVPFEEILKCIVPHDWFLPVTPGTKYVTVGGAIANDVHGKNHHRAGTFGCHVRQFELLRSNGERLICSASQNTEMYQATIGGLGLTGLILWAEFNLQPIKSQTMDMEIIKIKNLDHFLELSDSSDKNFEYTVTWLDSLAKGNKLGRGLLIRGNHATQDDSHSLDQPIIFRQRTFPFNAPSFLLNRFSIKMFNIFHYHQQRAKTVQKKIHFNPFFYPLDGIAHWNRIYGKRGLFQYQCVIPDNKGLDPIKRILETVSQSSTASFLTVFKKFGSVKSPGLLSFPKKGATLALDFPNNGEKTFLLIDQLDKIVLENGGSVYPAKDARMSADSFKKFFPNWNEFLKFIDIKFSSSFWRRVTK